MALDYLPSPGWAVIYGETPSADRWSELGENDDALAKGVGLDDNAIINRHVTNQILDWNKLNAATMYRCHVRPNVDRSIAAATGTPYPFVTFDVAKYNVGSMWSSGAANRVTIPAKGLYLLHGTFGMDGNATGRRGIDFVVNGVAPADGNELTPLVAAVVAQNIAMEATEVLELNAADYVQLSIYQDSGAARTLQFNRTHMTVTLLARLP